MGGKGNEEGGGTAFEEGERGEGEGRRAELMFLAPFVVVFFSRLLLFFFLPFRFFCCQK